MDNRFLIDFADWYKGKKLSFIITGGGVSLSQLMFIPGSSDFIHSVYIPYETNETVRFIDRYYPFNECIDRAENFKTKAVSAEAAQSLYHSLRAKNEQSGYYDLVANIAVTAAITSNRYRRGDNKAFIAFRDPEFSNRDQRWQLKLEKLPEAEHLSYNRSSLMAHRMEQDSIISKVALCLATDYHKTSELYENWIGRLTDNGTLTRISL